eukprot:2244778-Amphidinium_carterae.1
MKSSDGRGENTNGQRLLRLGTHSRTAVLHDRMSLLAVGGVTVTMAAWKEPSSQAPSCVLAR